MIIPEAAQQQHIAVLGKNGSGKTYAAKAVLVEPMLTAGKRVAIIDPTSAWWGLRTSADGRGPGFKVLVLGGDHGDLPLPVHGGAAVARLVVEQGVNLVADTGNLTVGERTRWMIDFAGALYRLNRTPLHLVIDEAHVFAPQGKVPDPDTGRMLHAVNQIAAGGRSRGIRLTMLTQRPQKLHKDTLTTADTLIAMRVLAPQDREAVKAWIDGCGNPAQGKEVLDSLAQLQRGEGWVWYPEGGVLQRMRFPQITTFDSSATPKDGDVIEAPRGAAEIDLTEIKAALAEAAKEAAANDPKALKARIAALERQLTETGNPVTATDQQLADEYRRGREDVLQSLQQWLANIQGGVDAIEGALAEIERMSLSSSENRTGKKGQGAPAMLISRTDNVGEENQHRRPCESGDLSTGLVNQKPVGASNRPIVASPVRSAASSAANGALPRAERLILTALAQYPKGRSKVQVAILTGYAVGGGGFSNAVSSLRTKGFLEGDAARLVITSGGIATLGDYDRLPHGHELLQHWLSQLGKAERKALETLAEAYPRTLSKAQLANRAGYEANGGGFNNALSRLRTLELIAGRAELKASDALFG